jgi:hypothetical protein
MPAVRSNISLIALVSPGEGFVPFPPQFSEADDIELQRLLDPHTEDRPDRVAFGGGRILRIDHVD